MVLEIPTGLRALPVKEERVVPRQLFHPQVPYEVFIVVVYPISTKEMIVQFHINIIHTTKIQPKSIGLVKNETRILKNRQL